jgi:cytochrome c peroxidase
MKPSPLLSWLLTPAAVVSGGALSFAADNAVPFSPETQREIARVEAEIDGIETESLRRLEVPPDNQVQQIELLGKLMLFDKELSVNRNEACAFCHMPETGFTGPISEFNRTTGSYPGSVRTRFSERKPQTHTYAPLSPVLHYNEGQGDLVDGNFWDMRATGVASAIRQPSRLKDLRRTRPPKCCPGHRDSSPMMGSASSSWFQKTAQRTNFV